MIKLRDMVSEADEDSVYAADEKQAKQLKKPLTNAIAGIGRSIDIINRGMSDFNAPGLKHAFIDAIKIGVNVRENLMNEQLTNVSKIITKDND